MKDNKQRESKEKLVIIMDDRDMVRAAFFDVDGTLTSGRTWKGFMEYFRQNREKTGTYYLYLGYHYPLYFLKKAGLITEGGFRAPWAANMAWFVRGYSLEQAEKVWDYSVDYLDRFWRSDTIRILNEHKDNGDLVMLVSSGPEPLLRKTAQKLGVDHFVGTKFEIMDNVFTGRSLKPTCIEEYKASMSRDYLVRNGFQVDYASSYSYADSIADLSMLEMVGNPTAVYADESLLELARQRGWKIYPEHGYP